MNDLMDEIRQLRIDINLIKDNIANNDNDDNVLTMEEEKRLDQAMDEYKRGEAITLEEIEVARKNAGFEIQ